MSDRVTVDVKDRHKTLTPTEPPPQPHHVQTDKSVLNVLSPLSQLTEQRLTSDTKTQSCSPDGADGTNLGTFFKYVFSTF